MDPWVVPGAPTDCTRLTHPRGASQQRRRRADIARIRELLGWEPKVDLETGLQRTVKYFAGTLAGLPRAGSGPV